MNLYQLDQSITEEETHKDNTKYNFADSNNKDYLSINCSDNLNNEKAIIEKNNTLKTVILDHMKEINQIEENILNQKQTIMTLKATNLKTNSEIKLLNEKISELNNLVKKMLNNNKKNKDVAIDSISKYNKYNKNNESFINNKVLTNNIINKNADSFLNNILDSINNKIKIIEIDNDYSKIINKFVSYLILICNNLSNTLIDFAKSYEITLDIFNLNKINETNYKNNNSYEYSNYYIKLIYYLRLLVSNLDCNLDGYILNKKFIKFVNFVFSCPIDHIKNYNFTYNFNENVKHDNKENHIDIIMLISGYKNNILKVSIMQIITNIISYLICSGNNEDSFYKNAVLYILNNNVTLEDIIIKISNICENNKIISRKELYYIFDEKIDMEDLYNIDCEIEIDLLINNLIKVLNSYGYFKSDRTSKNYKDNKVIKYYKNFKNSNNSNSNLDEDSYYNNKNPITINEESLKEENIEEYNNKIAYNDEQISNKFNKDSTLNIRTQNTFCKEEIDKENVISNKDQTSFTDIDSNSNLSKIIINTNNINDNKYSKITLNNNVEKSTEDAEDKKPNYILEIKIQIDNIDNFPYNISTKNDYYNLLVKANNTVIKSKNISHGMIYFNEKTQSYCVPFNWAFRIPIPYKQNIYNKDIEFKVYFELRKNKKIKVAQSILILNINSEDISQRKICKFVYKRVQFINSILLINLFYKKIQIGDKESFYNNIGELTSLSKNLFFKKNEELLKENQPIHKIRIEHSNSFSNYNNLHENKLYLIKFIELNIINISNLENLKKSILSNNKNYIENLSKYYITIYCVNNQKECFESDNLNFILDNTNLSYFPYNIKFNLEDIELDDSEIHLKAIIKSNYTKKKEDNINNNSSVCITTNNINLSDNILDEFSILFQNTKDELSIKNNTNLLNNESKIYFDLLVKSNILNENKNYLTNQNNI